MKKILIINGHPNAKSYCAALCDAYLRGAIKSGHEVVLLNLHELKFDLNFNGSYAELKTQTVEKDLIFAQEKITRADHLVIVHPVWWGSVPALLKGFFDKTLLPGFAFKYRKGSAFWDKLLSNKTKHYIYDRYTALVFPYFFQGTISEHVKAKNPWLLRHQNHFSYRHWSYKKINTIFQRNMAA